MRFLRELINRDAGNGKSKRHVKKIIEKIYEDVLQDVDKSKQNKKTYLISVINEVETIIPKPDNKQLNDLHHGYLSSVSLDFKGFIKTLGYYGFNSNWT